MPQDIQPIGNHRRYEARGQQSSDLPLIFPDKGKLRSISRTSEEQCGLHVTQGLQPSNIITGEVDIGQKRLQPGPPERDFPQARRRDGTDPPSAPWLGRNETLVRQPTECGPNNPTTDPIGIAKDLLGEPLTRRKLTELDRIPNPFLGEGNEITGTLDKKGTLMIEHIVKLTSQLLKLKYQISYSLSFL